MRSSSSRTMRTGRCSASPPCVGTIELPLRTSSSSPNTLRRRRSAALIAGCEWFSRTAVRVTLRSRSSVWSTRSKCVSIIPRGRSMGGLPGSCARVMEDMLRARLAARVPMDILHQIRRSAVGRRPSPARRGSRQSDPEESMSTLAIPAGGTTALEEHDLTFKKVVWRLIPFLTLVWFLAWVDRVNVGFAKLTMMSDLQWSDAVYGAGAGIFFLGYFFFEVPSNLLLQKIGAKKTIMRIAIGWGVVCVLMAWVQTPTQFYILRFLMGAFEAGLQPGVILYLTYWLPAHRRGKALAFFVSASAISLMVGSPLAAAIMTMFDGVAGHHGWQWLFIIEGIPSVLAGLAAYYVLTDSPRVSKWLSEREKAHVMQELEAENQALGPREHSFWASLRSGNLWVLILVYFCVVAGNATLVYYGPSLVREVGFTDIKT